MRRFDQLDSIRGLAALTVVAAHVLMIFPTLSLPAFRKMWEVIWFTPLHGLFAGSDAVILFFVLSGFVLTLALSKGNNNYGFYAFRRFCRIYIPYAATLIFALIARALVFKDTVHYSSWFNTVWSEPFSSRLVMQHFSLVSSFPNDKIVPVVWSLVHEMRISLVFPFILWFMRRFNWKVNLGLSLGLAFVGFVLNGLSDRLLHVHVDYAETLMFIPMFMIGALLAENREVLIGRIQAQSRVSLVMLLVGALVLYTYHWWFFPSVYALHRGFIDNTIIASGASLLILIALASSRLSRFLLAPPILAIGKASYSLYLVHTVCLIGSIHLLNEIFPIGTILLIALVATAISTYLSYKFIELPSIQLSRSILTWLHSKTFKESPIESRTVAPDPIA